jgi:hypothetical protein
MQDCPKTTDAAVQLGGHGHSPTNVDAAGHIQLSPALQDMFRT